MTTILKEKKGQESKLQSVGRNFLYQIAESDLKNIMEYHIQKQTGIEVKLTLGADDETKRLFVCLTKECEEQLANEDEKWECLFEKYNFEEWFLVAEQLIEELFVLDGWCYPSYGDTDENVINIYLYPKEGESLKYKKDILPYFQHEVIHELCREIDESNSQEKKKELLHLMKVACDLSHPVLNKEQKEAYVKVLKDYKDNEVITLIYQTSLEGTTMCPSGYFILEETNPAKVQEYLDEGIWISTQLLRKDVKEFVEVKNGLLNEVISA